jgi:glycosyltransferase involved in cell wall biosynthesis
LQKYNFFRNNGKKCVPLHPERQQDMDKITAVIITQDEERNIGRCLESLREVADEVVVVDSGSTDKTEEICRGYGVRFEHHEWAGYSGQKNYANSLATHPWLLSIDADEALSPELRSRLLQMKEAGFDTDTVYSFNRLANYCGRWIRHCGWYPDRCVRLWHAGTATWDGLVHEELRYSKEVRHAVVEGDMWHYSYYTVDEHARRTVKYAAMAGEKAYGQGRRFNGSIGMKVAWTFLRNYLFRLGFMDGKTGYVVCKMSAFYTLIKYAKLRELSEDTN